MPAVHVIVSVLPTLIFLTALMFLDSYRLVSFRALTMTILAGIATALGALGLNTLLIQTLQLDANSYSLFWAPIAEETLKMAYPMYLLSTKKAGFLVDVAIYGFAVGCGFALSENVYYLLNMVDPSFVTFLIRGLGTAVMHGGTTAISLLFAKGLTDRLGEPVIKRVFPGLMVAVLVHAAFNHLSFSPEVMTIAQLIFLPILLAIVFHKSERSMQNWLGMGLDADLELMEMIHSGKIHQTRIGAYLQSVQSWFSGSQLTDMLSLLQINAELSLRAKGLLMMREHGFRVHVGSDIREKFLEMDFLEKSIGKVGMLSIRPFLHRRRNDLWQLYFLKGE